MHRIRTCLRRLANDPNCGDEWKINNAHFLDLHSAEAMVFAGEHLNKACEDYYPPVGGLSFITVVISHTNNLFVGRTGQVPVLYPDHCGVLCQCVAIHEECEGQAYERERPDAQGL